MTTVLLIIWMSVLSRLSGGGLFADKLKSKAEGGAMPFNLSFIPEFLFGVTIGCVFAVLHGYPFFIITSAAMIWSMLWMQTGHGTAFYMGLRPQDAQSGRKQFLSPVVDPICKIFGEPLGGGLYCWLFMGLKGLLIGLPMAPVGLLLAILWPSAYYVGRHYVKNHAWTEYAAGGAAGLCAGLALIL